MSEGEGWGGGDGCGGAVGFDERVLRGWRVGGYGVSGGVGVGEGKVEGAGRRCCGRRGKGERMMLRGGGRGGC